MRRLELDLALDALRGPGGDAPLSLFLPLSRHRPARAGGDPPPPRDWLEREWAQRYPRLPGLPELFRRGPFLLLLDAVNEIPHAGPEDYRGRIGLWRELLADLAREAPGVRAVFTCRSLDYSALLSTPESPVPQVRIEPLEDARVEQFLGAYDPARGPDLWRDLRGTPQLDLFRSPFYLRLLLAHRGSDGRLAGTAGALHRLRPAGARSGRSWIGVSRARRWDARSNGCASRRSRSLSPADKEGEVRAGD